MLSLKLDGSLIEIKDQIQMYAPNHMLTHPLVSPVLQPTLGGLPPLLIQVGGGELLHDEQVYLAHKAAAPLAYVPPPSNHLTVEEIQARCAKYRPTNVQLQVWDDLCHVAPTLSFTRPAKHMYRSIAQFGAWALARAQKTSIDILDDDSISFVSTGSSESSATTAADNNPSPDEIKLSMPQSAQHVGFESITKKKTEDGVKVGRAGDPLPSFEKHMIRQRIDRHGRIYAMAPPEELAELKLPTAAIGVPKSGPVNKWMKAQQQWNGKFAKEKIRVQKKRMKDMEKGYVGFEGETPPPTALAGRRVKGMKAEKKKKKSWGMAMWSIWGSKHDEATVSRSATRKASAKLITRQIVREEKADHAPDVEPSTTTAEPTDGAFETPSTEAPPTPPPKSNRRTFPRNRALSLPRHPSRSRSHSRHSNVTDKGQIGASIEDLNRLAPPPNLAEATQCAPERKASPLPSPMSEFSAPPGIVVEDLSRPQSPETVVPGTDGLSTRPFRGGIAYPFSLRVEGEGREVNASTITLMSVGVGSPGANPGLEEKDGGILAAGSDGATETETETETQKVGEGEKIDVGAIGGEEKERPGVERFVTAGAGDLNLIADSGRKKEEEKLERPGVERFETAQEDLSTLAAVKA
jgi:hypothetical protein